jgi:hypothetical protein
MRFSGEQVREKRWAIDHRPFSVGYFKKGFNSAIRDSGSHGEQFLKDLSLQTPQVFSERKSASDDK